MEIKKKKKTGGGLCTVFLMNTVKCLHKILAYCIQQYFKKDNITLAKFGLFQEYKIGLMFKKHSVFHQSNKLIKVISIVQ